MSDVKPVFFIVTFLERGKIVHQIAPNKEGKYNKQNCDDAALQSFWMRLSQTRKNANILRVLQMVQPPRDHLLLSIKMTNAKHASTETRPGGNCHDHERVHYLRKCLTCHQLVKNSTFPTHKRQFQSLTLAKLHCGIENCSFSIYHDSYLRKHRTTSTAKFL